MNCTEIIRITVNLFDRRFLHVLLPCPDLMEVKVESVEEAINLLRVGLHHRHTAETRLNYASSRSHSIFTIKLLRVAQGFKRPKVTRVNR